MDRLISVVIPTFDRKDLTDRAVESVAPSRPDLFEIIIVDDCGNVPYSYDKASNDHGVLVYTFRSATNAGPGLARRLGVEKSSGSVISFLDSDDIFEAGWPDAILAEVLKQDPTLRDDLFIAGRAEGGSSLVTDWCARRLAMVPEPLKAICVRLVVIGFNPFYTPATAISKQLCSFSPVERYCEDYFTNAMAILRAKVVSVLPETACTISRVPGTPGGLTESQREMWRGEFKVRKGILLNPAIPLVYRVLVPFGMAYAATRNLFRMIAGKRREVIAQ
jgi:glycosyltransferase involved in cell wall biosynthesis